MNKKGHLKKTQVGLSFYILFPQINIGIHTNFVFMLLINTASMTYN